MHVSTSQVIQITALTNALSQQWVYIIVNRAQVFVLSNHTLQKSWLLFVKCLSLYLVFNVPFLVTGVIKN